MNYLFTQSKKKATYTIPFAHLMDIPFLAWVHLQSIFIDLVFFFSNKMFSLFAYKKKAAPTYKRCTMHPHSALEDR